MHNIELSYMKKFTYELCYDLMWIKIIILQFLVKVSNVELRKCL